jgi:hypothetical protein
MLVFQGRMSPEYVMDMMEMYEVDCLMSHLYLASKDTWEQTRLMGYISAQTHSTKHMSMSDIVTFPWEENAAHHHDTSMSNADKRRLEQKAKQLEKLMNKK